MGVCNLTNNREKIYHLSAICQSKGKSKIITRNSPVPISKPTNSFLTARQKQFNDLSGEDYREKAKVMFEEMDLDWDLGEYEKYVNIDMP